MSSDTLKASTEYSWLLENTYKCETVINSEEANLMMAVNMSGLRCKFVTHAQRLQTAQRPAAVRGACEILEGVVRAFREEVTWSRSWALACGG